MECLFSGKKIRKISIKVCFLGKIMLCQFWGPFAWNVWEIFPEFSGKNMKNINLSLFSRKNKKLISFGDHLHGMSVFWEK